MSRAKRAKAAKINSMLNLALQNMLGARNIRIRDPIVAYYGGAYEMR